MNKYKLQPLNNQEKSYAEEHHKLVYNFLHKKGYSIEEYYSIAVIGYLKAVQIYHRREDLRSKYDFPFISWQYMRSEIGNHFRMENSKKRKPSGEVISLDAEYSDMESLYNSVGGKSAESNVMEIELIADIMKGLSEAQRKIVQLKIDGYSNKEVHLLLKIPSSTYYKEMQKIKVVTKKLLIG